MDSNVFRAMVGLNKYENLKHDLKKLQIVYACMKLAMGMDRNSRLKHLNVHSDPDSQFNAVPRMEHSWIKLLQNPDNFSSLECTKSEVDAVLNDIASVDDIKSFEFEEDNDDEDEELDGEPFMESGDGQQYSMQFTDREEVEKRRQQVRKAHSKHTMRSFLMDKDNIKHHEEEEDDAIEYDTEEYDGVKIQQVEMNDDDGHTKKKKKKRSKS